MPDVRQERHGVLGMANNNLALAGVLATSFAKVELVVVDASEAQRTCAALATANTQRLCIHLLHGGLLNRKT